MNVRQSDDRNRGMRHISLGMHDLKAGGGRICEDAGKGNLLASLDENSLFEAEALPIWKEQ